MAFIIRKISKRNGKIRSLYYLVINYRKGNRIKRKTLLKLNENKTPSELFVSTTKECVNLLNRLHTFEQEREDFIKYGKVPPLFFGSPFQLRKRLDRSIKETEEQMEQCQKKIYKIKKYVKV